MDQESNIKHNIGFKIKELRIAKKISIDKLAQKTGVSALTINKIENGNSNPTINTLWKLTNFLGVPLMYLFNSQENQAVFSNENRNYFLEDDNRNIQVEPILGQPDFEVYKVKLKANSSYFMDKQTPKTLEVVTVLQGVLDLKVDDETYTVHQMNTIYFMSNNYHEYINETNEDVLLNIIVKYKNL